MTTTHLTTVDPRARSEHAAEPGTDSRVAIVGLGYVGLPLALSFVEAGLDVVGVDAWEPRVRELREGRSPIDDIDDARLQEALAGRLRIVHSTDAGIAAVDVVFV